MLNPTWDVHIWGDIKNLKKKHLYILCYYINKEMKYLVYVYKQGWKSIHKKYKACWSKCKHMKGKQNN